MTNVLLGVLPQAIFNLCKTNQSRSLNGTFEGGSFRQACAVMNEDSRCEVVITRNILRRKETQIRNEEKHIHISKKKKLKYNG